MSRKRMAPVGRPDRGKKAKENDTGRTALSEGAPEKRTDESAVLADIGKKKKSPGADICEAPMGKPGFD